VTESSARIVRIMVWTIPLLALALAAGAATPSGPTLGAWATYQWTSSISQEVPVVGRQEGADGRVTWSVSRESTAPRPLFVTFGIVGGDAGTYTLQIVTSRALDGPPLSVTQLRVDRGSGKALRSVIRTPKGVTSTPDDPLRPFRTADVKGTSESVSVPAGQLMAVRGLYRDGTVWVADEVPAMGLVKAVFPSGILELVRSAPAGAEDLLRS
jgi:hypothetical protein